MMMFYNATYQWIGFACLLMLTGCTGFQGELWVDLGGRVLQRHRVISSKDAEDMAEAGRILFGPKASVKIEKGGK